MVAGGGEGLKEQSVHATCSMLHTTHFAGARCRRTLGSGCACVALVIQNRLKVQADHCELRYSSRT
jgi:hypothetical protein